MLWKELFARTASINLGIVGRIAMALIMVSTVGIACFAFYWIVFEKTNRWQEPWEEFIVTTVFTNVLYGSGIVLLVGARAAGLVSFEKERDCWLSLIATPLSGSEIVFAKVLGNLYAFRWLPLPMFIVWGSR